MKVYLLNPPSDRPMLREGRCQNPSDMRRTHIPQLSLAYIGTQAIRLGAEVQLCDAIARGLTLRDILPELSRWKPRILFANVSTPTIKMDLEVLASIKSALPETVIAAFGPHASATHDSLISNRCLDVVIRGEPEATAGELMARLMGGRSFLGVSGITWRADHEVRIEPERAFIDDLDQLGWPARELLPNDLYIHPVSGQRYTMVNISRGCRFKCIFCVAPVYYGSMIRKRSAADVLDEIQNDIVGRHGIRHVWFFADDLLADKEYLRQICRGIIDRKIRIRWWGNTRADAKDRELFGLMARSGCFMLSVGGESGDDAVLRGAKKALRAQDIAETAAMLREAGITSLVYFLLGLPGETRETLQRTVEFAKKADPDYVEFYPAVPFPGTELERIARERDLIIDENPGRIECGGTRFVLKVEGMTEGELEREVLRAYRSFYARPRSVLRLLGSVRSPREMMNLCSFGAGYWKRLLRVPFEMNSGPSA